MTAEYRISTGIVFAIGTVYVLGDERGSTIIKPLVVNIIRSWVSKPLNWVYWVLKSTHTGNDYTMRRPPKGFSVLVE